MSGLPFESELLRRILWRTLIGIYLLLGIYTEIGLIQMKPLPETFLDDFAIYERAAKDAVQGKDPYSETNIGSAFLYPPQSLLFFEIFNLIRQRTVQIWFFFLVNIGLMTYMVYGVIKYYKLSQSQAWFLYPLALGFAPFLEVLHVGQVNQFVEFGLFLTFVYSASLPILAALGLSIAILFKVTPVVFALYLFVTKKWKALVAAVAIILFISFLAWIRYGGPIFGRYLEVFRYLLGQFPSGFISHSLFAVINRLWPIESYATILNSGLRIYLLLVMASSLISYYTGNMNLFFVVVGLAVTLTSNVLWYHHYVFFLLPLLILMCWSRLNPYVVAWCLLGFIIIQIDRFYLTAGLLIHIFGHTTVIALLAYQILLGLTKPREGAQRSAQLI